MFRQENIVLQSKKTNLLNRNEQQSPHHKIQFINFPSSQSYVTIFKNVELVFPLAFDCSGDTTNKSRYYSNIGFAFIFCGYFVDG